MTAKAALAKALLDGKTVNIKNCFTTIGLTNAPREISRLIEQPFGVIISKLPRTGKSRYGQAVSWYDYRLNPLIEGNAEGIKLMKEYVAKQMGNDYTTEENKQKFVTVDVFKQ